jgi:hypothetical protein
MNKYSKRSVKLICTALIVLQSNLLTAQIIIDKSVLEHFNAGVIAKVFSIAKHTQLSPESEWYLANYFNQTDSTIKAWLVQGKPLAQIDSLQKSSEAILFQLHHVGIEAKTAWIKDSLMKVSFIKDGMLVIPFSQFSIALKCKEKLSLSPLVIDSLVYYTVHLSEMFNSLMAANPYTIPEFYAYESLHLSQLLTEEQYTRFLQFKNQPTALTEANKNWAEIEKHGLNIGLNKEQSINEITAYYIKRFGNWNRYAHDGKKQYEDMLALEDTKPIILKQLDAARRKEEQENSGNNLKFQW